MSATATTTRRVKVGRPTAPAPTMAAALTDQQQDRAWLEALCAALKAAADADCPHLHSGESDRLLSAAFDLATLISDPEGELQPADRDACHTVAAMVKAALQVPGDCPTPERLAFVEQARAPLIGLTEDPAVLDGWETYPRTPAAAATPSPARPRDWLPDVEAKAREAAAVLRSLAEDSGTEEIWGLLRLVQWLIEQAQTRVEDARASTTPFADSAANVACVLSILNLVAEHDDHVLIHAAGSILNVAAAYCEEAMEAGHA